MKFIMKHGKSDKDIHNLRQEIEVLLTFYFHDGLSMQFLLILFNLRVFLLQILRKLKHENIIEMLDSFESPQEFCVVTEFAQVMIP